jgi:DNA-binding XRE family transcriptional regulator
MTGRSSPNSADLGEARVLAASIRMAQLHKFAAHVGALRVAAGLTDLEFAKRCALKVETIRAIEQARIEPCLTLLVILRDGLRVSSDTLIGNL